MHLALRAAVLSCLACALALAARAAPAGTLLDLREGHLTYHLVHKLHEVTGTTSALEGKALLQPDGSAKVQVRAKVAGFDSGNSNRDVHMREVTHEAIHPYTTLRGTLAELKLPLAAPLSTTLPAAVELNGEKLSFDIPVTLEQAGDAVRARFTFAISLDAFKIDRPELLFVKVDDKVVLDGELLFGPAK